MITFPNAKINLGLNIVERRADGYHNLETVFYPIALTAVAGLNRAAAGRRRAVGVRRGIAGGGFLRCRGRVGACRIALRGAGLGGGSSDAAHVLTMLNQMFKVGADDATLAALAASLGADCPFFVYNCPMLATGIGDVLTPVELDLKGMTLMLVKPPVSVSTKTAYARVVPRPSVSDLRSDVKRPLLQWDGVVKNDFEVSVFAEYPQLGHIKLQLQRGGARYAAMSGSGSAMFGIFDDVKMAEALIGCFDGCDTFVTPL